MIVAKSGAAPGSTLRPFVSVYNMGIAKTQKQYRYNGGAHGNSKLGANSPYYLTTTGVCVFFNPYEVARFSFNQKSV